MANIHARSTRILWNGYDVTAYFKDVNTTQKVDNVDVTTFTSSATPAKSFLLGFREGDLKLTGLYDPTAVSGPDALLSAVLGDGGVNVSICWAGTPWAIGDRGISMLLREDLYDIKGNVGSAVSIDAGGKADGGIDYVRCLHTSETAVTSSESPSTGVDFGASDTGPWAAYLHATACAGTATISVKTSPTNSTFATTLTTFTGLTTVVTSELKTGTSATAYQYAAAFSVLASSPSYNYAVFLGQR